MDCDQRRHDEPRVERTVRKGKSFYNRADKEELSNILAMRGIAPADRQRLDDELSERVNKRRRRGTSMVALGSIAAFIWLIFAFALGIAMLSGVNFIPFLLSLGFLAISVVSVAKGLKLLSVR